MKYKKKFNESVLSISTEIVLDDKITDEEILRIAISAEQSAINLYSNLVKYAKSNKLKNVLKDITKEEKIHIGEFWAILRDIDIEELPSILNGISEINAEI